MLNLLKEGIPVLIISLNPSADEDVIEKAKSYFERMILMGLSGSFL